MCKWGDTTQVLIGVEGKKRIVDVDSCISGIVDALNYIGWATVASCCGHGKRPGNIMLVDGRELIICPDFETGRMVDKYITSQIRANGRVL